MPTAHTHRRVPPQRRGAAAISAKRGAAASGRGVVIAAAVASALMLAWAITATWIAVDSRSTIAQLVDEQAELRRSYEEKVRALTRRLVGVASSQVLEQDGLEGRMADLITRQVQLENRQAVLTSLVSQAGISTAAVEAAPAAVQPPRSRLPEPLPPAHALDPPSVPPRGASPGSAAVPSLRLGSPDAAIKGPPAAPPAPSPIPAPEAPAPILPVEPSDQLLRPQSHLPLKERFALLEASMSRVDVNQRRALEGLTQASQGQVALIRAAIAEVGLQPDRIEPPAAKVPAGGPLIPIGAKGPTDAFEAGVLQVQRGLAQLHRWRPVITALPFRPPLESGDESLTSNFGPRADPFTGATAMHSGMDFRATEGTAVRAAGSGKVSVAEASGGYGNLVEIDHGHGVSTRYGHLSSIAVSEGQTIAAGSVVGRVGSTGRSTGPHLHYETRIGGAAIDPARFLKAGAKLTLPEARRPE